MRTRTDYYILVRSLSVLQIPEQPGRFAYPDIVPGVDVERRGGTAEALACQRHLVPAWIARRPGDEIVERCQRPAEATQNILAGQLHHMFPDIVLLVRQIDVERLGGVKPVLRRQPEAVADADALLLGRVGRQTEALGRRHIVKIGREHV